MAKRGTPARGGSRRRSRIVALQTLYEHDLSGHTLRTVLPRKLRESRLPDEASAFVRSLVNGVEAHLDQLDRIIERLAPAFPLSDMSAVDRNVLRLAIYEMLFDNRRAPTAVVINEAVELAKGYGSDSSGRFVHGVLGAVALEAAASEAAAPEATERPDEEQQADEPPESSSAASAPSERATT